MGIWDVFTDIVEAATPWSVVEAEAPAAEEEPQCAPAKHHFEHCVERVQEQQENGGAKEDCVEEFFHLAHCATECAAPKLWAKLK
ncbi:ubiquinol-cytochrome c reductase subunit 6 [Geosmithia morbida]|uniref:Ubiquinol-cytochrome c reductase subunit 6 n=1 Tax=Geosmithia morbida TaxID=1094350 RepID=A0A9P4YTH7_9HYPO|nr:ubiquinol-cytochrome c reductase subunit 6 [Geosmithia morbida]KAF4122813.1 ubiquinol-cytochrome c reductase subunit 6 [Geosmithia morbida]